MVPTFCTKNLYFSLTLCALIFAFNSPFLAQAPVCLPNTLIYVNFQLNNWDIVDQGPAKQSCSIQQKKNLFMLMALEMHKATRNLIMGESPIGLIET